MKRLERLRQILRSTIFAGQFMVAGAWLLASYLEWRDPSLPQIRGMQSSLMFGFFILMFADDFLRPAGASPRQPSPRVSGTGVVIATGFAAAFAVRENPVAGVLVALTTLIVAALVWRFATARAGEIGEARFASAAQIPE
jgi:hypothetical protein